METGDKSNTARKNSDSEIKKKSRMAALLFMLFWIVTLGYPLFSYTFPLPEKPGILMAFGDEDGGGDGQGNLEKTNGEANEKEEEISDAPVKEKVETASLQETTAKSVTSNLQSETDEYSNIKTSTKEEKKTKSPEKSQESKNTQKVEAPSTQNDEDAQLKRQEAEKQKKAREEALKKEFSDLLGGSGDGAKDATGGDPNGVPNERKLEGISKGNSKIGGGLADRGVLFEPTIDENSQKTGRVVVRVCVDRTGAVTEGKFTQKGSTTTDYELIQVAEKAARQYKFSASGLEKQCGTISIDFKLK